MRLRLIPLGGVGANVLLPWLLLLVIVLGLLGFRFYQDHRMTLLEDQSALHRQATLHAIDLTILAQERWSDVLIYRGSRNRSITSRLQRSHIETERKIDALERLFHGEGAPRNQRDNSQARSLLESYRIVRAGVPELYERFVDAIDVGDLGYQAKLAVLLSDKVVLVSAALDDLMTYHRKTEALFETNRKLDERQSNLLFSGLLAALIAIGVVFSLFQTLAIVRPLGELTLAARKIGAGESADLSGFAGKGEIGELSLALSQMVSALQSSHAELAASRDRLAEAYADVEDQVRERTADLSRRTKELVAANNDLEGFSYSVSHDLRAPLRAIDGFIAILLEDYGPLLDEEGKRLFAVVQQNANKMSELIDDILAFSRASRKEMENAPVDMNALVDTAWTSLGVTRDERPVEFHCADLPSVRGDAGALQQVWVNLLGNALKFSRDRDPARIEVSAEQRDELIWFSVKDNGVGFNSEYAGKLFSLFLRLHGMDEFEGTGVGLAIVKRFVAKHGGQVSAEATVGEGATIGFGLPIDRLQSASNRSES